MKFEAVRPAGVVALFLKTMVTVWPGGINDGSVEIESHGVRGWSIEPVIDETIE